MQQVVLKARAEMKSISVIIPTRNRSALLRKTLRSVLAQALPVEGFEVIVVDNDSSDNTREVAEDFLRTSANVIYTVEKKPGLHEGRHAGLRLAGGRILAYIDDDVEVFPGWLEGIHESFRDETVGLVGGKDVPVFESDPPEWVDALWEMTPAGRYIPAFSLLDFGDEVMEIAPEFVFGCNFSVRKDLLLKIGGFHPDGMPEGLEAYRGDGETFVARETRRLGYRIIYNPKASVGHWVPSSRMTMEYVRKRAFASGISQSFTDTRAEGDQPQAPWFSRLLQNLGYRKAVLLASPVRREILKAYRQGYDYHQDKLRTDRSLRAWVHRESYW